MRMNIVVFTGAGISKESGLNTFRDTGGIWEKYDPNHYATKSGWKKDREGLLDFYNMLKGEFSSVKPNAAHIMLADLEKYHNVTIITQNVDNLHEKAGSSNVLHLHGDMSKSQSTLNPSITYDAPGDIKIGDKCEKGSQLRHNIVLFGEYPNNIEESTEALKEADLLLIIGTSLSINYTISLLSSINEAKTHVIYIDPYPSKDLEFTEVEYIKDIATSGLASIFKGLIA